MNDGSIFYKGFMSALQNKISHRGSFVNTISDMLVIDKDAAYRRLRGEVNFSFSEMCIIAKHFGISLDQISAIDTAYKKPSQVNINRYHNPTEIDYKMFQSYVDLLKTISDEPESIVMEAGNMLPYSLYYDYDYLTQYAFFKWNLSSSYAKVLPFHEINVPERLRSIQKEGLWYIRKFKSSLFVWDCMIFQHLITNIKYYTTVKLINNEDVSHIKNELLLFVDYLEKLTIRGKHEDTGNEVSIFISDTNFDTNYALIKSKNLCISIFKIFLLNSAISFDVEVFNETYTWIQSLQKTSTLISVSGEKIRTEFFEKQRQTINTL